MIPSTHPDQSPRATGLGTDHAGQHAHRPLSDDVLQSAQDAVAAEGADDYAGLSRGDYVARTSEHMSDLGPSAHLEEEAQGVQSPYTGRVSSRLEEFDPMESEALGVSRLTRYVKAEPAKAALMAAGAGALLAILMGRRRSSRAGRR